MKISDVRKDFDSFSLHIENLSLTKNKIHGIIGSNGCGKTTAMKIMAGLTPADSGEIDYGGLSRRDMTMVFKKPYLMHDSVMANLLYPLKIRRIKPDMQLIEHYLEITNLVDIRNQYAPSLSSGQQQKLSLIRALVFSPKLIFLDEALSNMDIESVAFFENYILDYQKNNPTTWVIISHHLSNIRHLCEYVFFMNNGKVCTSGATEQLLTDPKDEKLKQYLQYA